ncbi:ABC transporter [Actinomycetes bacterium]|nr:ABC transporter [Actinomycetes bacterium]
MLHPLVIDVSNLTKTYGGKTAVNGINLQVHKGEVFALLGPNGAGKTTTVEILEGYRGRDSGKVSVLGFDPNAKVSKLAERAWRDQIGIVLQTTMDALDLTVRETLTHFAKYYTNPKDSNAVIESVGLTEKVDEKVRTLSGGQRRRLDVALGIIGRPELLFLDEPTTGFDPEARRAFWELIRNLRDEGTSILLTTHYLDEAEALADRVAIINNGEILEVATPKTLGGRQNSKVEISWIENGEPRSSLSDTPTATVQELAARLGGEIAGLTVARPTLEDIYLKMIGENS